MPDLQLRKFTDPHEFNAIAGPFLAASEAAHCLAVGILGQLVSGERYSPAEAVMVVVEDAGKAVLVGLRTPPHRLVVSGSSVPESYAFLASRLAELDPELPGVHGPKEGAAAFATAWHAVTGHHLTVSTRLRIYELTEVVPVTGVPGASRRATLADHALLVEWFAGFYADAIPGENPDADANVTRWLASETGQLWFWEVDGVPVSFAGTGSPTPRGIRIGPVYTPGKQRGHGYASALVAFLSQLQLDSGREFVFLFTDLANPTSNSIYQKVGYRAVIDADDYVAGA